MGQFPCVCDNAMFDNSLMSIGQIFCILPILGCWLFHINFLDRFLEKKKNPWLSAFLYTFFRFLGGKKIHWEF